MPHRPEIYRETPYEYPEPREPYSFKAKKPKRIPVGRRVKSDAIRRIPVRRPLEWISDPENGDPYLVYP
ncbi:MAG: hypothetical protein OXM02_07145 [Bacteroidota bacterium]|nr:hypothetical protein [Bacteroidota bacterium]MDE2957904.1 hypothetical protein [Bacteroidota bacterium]